MSSRNKEKEGLKISIKNDSFKIADIPELKKSVIFFSIQIHSRVLEKAHDFCGTLYINVVVSRERSNTPVISLYYDLIK